RRGGTVAPRHRQHWAGRNRSTPLRRYRGGTAAPQRGPAGVELRHPDRDDTGRGGTAAPRPRTAPGRNCDAPTKIMPGRLLQQPAEKKGGAGRPLHPRTRRRPEGGRIRIRRKTKSRRPPQRPTKNGAGAATLAPSEKRIGETTDRH